MTTKPKRKNRVQVCLSHAESVKLAQVRRFVKQMSGCDSKAETVRFLIRNWSNP